MKHVIIGTAGHVDHGKTTLIQALTGINTDRLKEEQERGMTIDIGFASIRLPDGTIAGIVDVPGHERFLKNMLAGISGVDVVLLVIAADEGIMPQTIEHLDILRLLDVRNGVVALTKCDLADKEWMDVVEEDIRAHLKDTFLAGAPIVRVSAATGKGIEALKKILMSSVSRAEERSAVLPFRLPVDRVFTRPGFGTVVTGTLTAGTIHVGDALEIVPSMLQSRVRGLQVHGQKVTEAPAGSRVAVNIPGIETEAIERGAQIGPPGLLKPLTGFDAVLRLLPNVDAPLRDQSRVRVHIGTAEIIGRIRLLDNWDEIPSGERGYVQFRGEQEFTCLRSDRFIVRTYSPMQTIGGGIILDSEVKRHRKGDSRVLEALAARERGTPELLAETVLQGQPFGISLKGLRAAANLSPDETQSAMDLLVKSGIAIPIAPDRFVHHSLLASLTDRAVSALRAYHERFPLRAGMPKEELRAALNKDMDGRIFAAFLAYWQAQHCIISETTSSRLADFQITLSSRQEALLERIEAYYRECGIAMPEITDVVKVVHAPQDAVNALLRLGAERGRFHRIADDQYYHADTIRELQALVMAHVKEHGSLTVGAFRDLTHSNRRFSLLVLEYFDQIRFTHRVGDERVVNLPKE